MFAEMMETDWLAARLRPAAMAVERLLDELPELAEAAAVEPLTLVHYDIYPPNIALARSDPAADAVLVDWALATCDIAEIDLAFMFQQPYHSDRRLDWREVLRYYCDERARLTGQAYNWPERVLVFRYARIQAWFMSLVPIHLAWIKAVREDRPFGADAADPYARFYDALLNSLLATLTTITAEKRQLLWSQ
jgi:hypothetical protein